jgi:hypothetical protein
MMHIVRSIEKQSSHKPRLTKVDNQKTIDSSSYNFGCSIRRASLSPWWFRGTFEIVIEIAKFNK